MSALRPLFIKTIWLNFVIIPSFALDIDLNIITADSLFELGQYQTAESLYRQTILSAGDRAKGWSLKGLGNIAFVFGQVDSAEHYYRQALAWFEKTDEPIGQTRIWINLGSVAFQRGRFTEARQCWEKGLSLIERAGTDPEANQRDRISALANLGQVFRQTGDYARADSLFHASLSFSEAIGYARGAADNYYNLGDLARLKGEVAQALDYYTQAAQRYQQMGHFKLSADVLRETAAVYRRLGDFDKAYSALFQALAYLRLTKGDRPFIAGEAELINRLGLLHQEIGNLRLARDNFHKAHSIYQALADSTGIKDALMNLGSVFLKMAVHDTIYLDSTRKYYEQAMVLVRTERERAAIFNNLGVQSEICGDQRAAKKNYRQALKIYRHLKEITGLAQVFNNLGNLAVAAGDYSSAIDHYEEARRLIAGQHQPEWEASLLANLGHAYHRAGQISQAISNLSASVRIIEDRRRSVSSQEFRSRYLEDRITIYEELTACYLAQASVRESFNCAERAKARAFLDLVTGADISSRPDLTDTVRLLILQEQTAERKIDFYAGDTAQAQAIIEHDRILDELIRRYPAYQTLKKAEPVSVDELQAVLDPQTAVLEYFLGRDAGFAFCITRDRVAGFPLVLPPEKIYALVDSLRRAVRVKGDIFKYGIPLYQYLVAPVLAGTSGQNRLCIIPHSVLHHLPFVCLPVGSDTATMLLDKYEIFYAPSASAYCLSRQKRRTPAGPTALFAKSNFREHPEWFDIPLPGTARERDSLLRVPFFQTGRVFSDTDNKGRAPTETMVKDSGFVFSCLHFATHGKLDGDAPLESRIVLSADDRNDGNLTVREIFNLNLAAELVTMSACQTGQLKGFNETGKYSIGDELTGLSRAFLFAGVPSVIASLWKVSDASTVLLMTEFYRHLPFSGKAAALNAAQRVLRANEYYRAPFYWAAFVIIGDGD